MHADSRVQIIGHRGAAGHAPENTEAALLAGRRLGADAIEVDVQFTADGIPVVYHDRTLERMAGVKGRVRDHTARELSGYDIGFRFGDEHRGLRILSLAEAASLVPQDTALHVEVKDVDAVTANHLKEMLAVLRRRGGLERCLFSSFSDKILTILRSLEAKVQRGLLVMGRARGSVKRAVEIGCVSLHPEADQTDASLVEACRESGLKVYPFTANEAGQMRHLLALGVDGIYTDYPARLAGLLGRERPSPGEVPEIVAGVSPPEPRPGRERIAGRPRRGRDAAGRERLRRAPSAREHPPNQARTGGRGGAAIAATSAGEATSLDDAAEGLEAGMAIVEPRHERPAPVTEPPAGPEGLRKKRRRGKRGGRRHRKPAQGPPGGLSGTGGVAGGVEAPAVPTSEFTGDDEPILEIDEEPAPPAGAQFEEEGPLAAVLGADAPRPDEQTPPEGDAVRKKRRRGRRGGRKHRERRLRKGQNGAGGAGPEGASGGNPDDPS